jgi:hypothetical protein
MANTKTIFYGNYWNPDSWLNAECTAQDEITLIIKDFYPEGGCATKSKIILDRSTAIKLVKILRFEISKAEVKNG